MPCHTLLRRFRYATLTRLLRLLVFDYTPQIRHAAVAMRFAASLQDTLGLRAHQAKRLRRAMPLTFSLPDTMLSPRQRVRLISFVYATCLPRYYYAMLTPPMLLFRRHAITRYDAAPYCPPPPLVLPFLATFQLLFAFIAAELPLRAMRYCWHATR